MYSKLGDVEMYWLSIERYENWKTDEKTGFSFLGISDRKLKVAEEMKSRDLIITYISSGYGCFSDIREVVSDKPRRSKMGLVYDEPYPYQIDTKPLLILQKVQWLKIHNFVARLDFLSKGKDWRQVLRHSPRKLVAADAELIIGAIKDIYSPK